MNEKEFQEKYLEFQMISQQIEQLEQHIQRMHQHIGELNKVSESISEMQKTKKNNEILIHLGAGIFMKSELKDSSKVIMNVGSGVVIEKNVDDAKKLIENQLKEMQHGVIDVESQLVELSSYAGNLQEELVSHQNSHS